MKSSRTVKPILVFGIVFVLIIGCTSTVEPQKIVTITFGEPSQAYTYTAIATASTPELPTYTKAPNLTQTVAPSNLTPTLSPGLSFGKWIVTGLRNEAVYFLAISPNYESDSTLFAGGEEKVWKTTDGGDTWNTSEPAGGKTTALIISPNYAEDNTIFVALSGSGLYKSTDGGDSWIRVNENSNIETLAVSPDYKNDQTIFFGSAGGSDSGAYRSQDGGNSWSGIFNGINNVFVSSLAVSPDYASDHKLWAGANGWIYKSSDSGDNWGVALGGGQCLFGSVQSIRISPDYTSDGIAFASTENILLHADHNWSCTAVSLSSTIQDIELSPTFTNDHMVLVGTSDNGVLVTVDFGTNWMPVNVGLETQNVYAMAIGSLSTHILFVASDKGIWKNTWNSPEQAIDNNKDRWILYNSKNGYPGGEEDIPIGDIAIDKSSGEVWVATWFGVYVFNGDIWKTYTVEDGLASDFVRAIAIDQKGHKWFYSTVYKKGVTGISQFDGSKWTNYPLPFSGSCKPRKGKITVDQDDHIWFAITDCGVAEYDGHNWKTFTTSNPNNPDQLHGVSNILVDKKGNIWAGSSGLWKYDGTTWNYYYLEKNQGMIVSDFAMDHQGNLWIATDNRGLIEYDGNTLTQVSSSLKVFSSTHELLRAIAVDNQDHIWVGTLYDGLGEFDGTNWTIYTHAPAEKGLSGNSIYAIAVDSRNNIWVATDGGLCELLGSP